MGLVGGEEPMRPLRPNKAKWNENSRAPKMTDILAGCHALLAYTFKCRASESRAQNASITIFTQGASQSHGDSAQRLENDLPF